MARRTPGVRRAARGFPRDGPARAAASNVIAHPPASRARACLPGHTLGCCPGNKPARASRAMQSRPRCLGKNLHADGEAEQALHLRGRAHSPTRVLHGAMARKARAYFLDTTNAMPALGMHGAR